MKKLITILMMAFVITMVSCADRPTHPESLIKIGVVLTPEMLTLTIPTDIKTAIEETTKAAAAGTYISGGKATLPAPPSVSVLGIAVLIWVDDIKTGGGSGGIDPAVTVPTESILTAFNDILQPSSTVVNRVAPNSRFTVTWILKPASANYKLTLLGTAIAKPGYFIPHGLEKYVVEINIEGATGVQDYWEDVPE